MKAATNRINSGIRIPRISIHAAREGGDNAGARHLWRGHISIHAAREGGDAKSVPNFPNIVISIHAAREGGDPLEVLFYLPNRYFNPRRP